MKVKLLTKTEKLYGAVWNIWQASRTNDVIDNCFTNLEEARKLFFTILEEEIPIMEMVEFIFLLEDIPVSLREQIVRHRLGIKFDNKLGLDIVPDLIDSTFWCQSMRVIDMSDFDYYIPDKIQSNGVTLSIYKAAMKNIQIAYRLLVDAGIPREDARQVIPLGATHRMVWKLSLATVKHICSKRSCWIAQLGMWKPIIKGMVKELVEIDPQFYKLVAPPCIKQEKFHWCKFCEHNKKRILGEGEEMPPCPLYLHHHSAEAIDTATSKRAVWKCVNGDFVAMPKMAQKMFEMKEEYRKFWNRDVNTGELL